MALSKMRYKGFKFPNNPETSSFDCDRSYAKHKYPQLTGSELEDFGPNAMIISGSGEFFGDNAYTYWNNLLTEYNKPGVGSVYHPVFKYVTRGLMTRLKADLEPKSNYVKYSFEIVADGAPSITKTDVTATTNKVVSSADGIQVGDVVNFTGTKHYSSSGSGATGYTCKPGKAKVTDINKSGAHPYHLIHINGGGSTVYGWVDAKYINSKVTSTKDTTQNKHVHVVVSGETLSGICASYSKRYGVSINWRNIASYNKLKNPNDINIGQKITIVW
jgi:LysM repeat protein